MAKSTPEQNTKRVQTAKERLQKLGKAASSVEVRSARKQVKRMKRKVRSQKQAQVHLDRRHKAKAEA